MRTGWAWLCGSTVVLLAQIAHADTCPAPEGGSPQLARIDSRERIDFLHRTETDQARYARTWKWSWFGIGTALTVSNVAQAIGWAVDGNDDKHQANVIDNLIVAGFSAVTPIAAMLFSLRVESDAPAIDQLLIETNNGEAGTCLVLARMEELFKKGAEEEELNTAWFQHVIAMLGVGAMFTIMAVEAATASNPDVREAHWINAITNGVGGVILTEAQLLTSPTGAASGYKRYLKGQLPERKKASLSLIPLAVAPGVALRVVF